MRIRLVMLALVTFIISGVYPAPLAPDPVSASSPMKPSSTPSDTPASGSDVGEEQLTLGQLRQKYADTFKTNGPSTKQVALTFDDVPDPRFTPQVPMY